ncbi:MAG: tRNA lysidine(34) synthetase TilS [Anaerolineales bacterium]|jgi:tRNA(Ile)-lysidine synthase
MEFLDRVAAFIQANQLLRTGQSLVAGISGGPDSVCLLDCLVVLGYRPVPVYIDHGLRPESPQEGRFVSTLAEAYGLGAIVKSVDVKGLVEQLGGSLEERARQARYQLLLQAAHEQGLDTIATAHHADDQIETVLLHFLRGSGLAGLRGMKPSTDLTGWFDSPYGVGKRLVRPLLGVDSQQILDYLSRRNVDYQIDASNVDLAYRRNRIRHELLPFLQTFNPAIKTNLLRLSNIMAEQSAWVDQLVADHWDDVVTSDDAQQWILDPDKLGRLPAALQKELMLAVLSKLPFAELEPDYDLVQASVDFCLGKARSRTLAGGVKLERVGDQVIVAQEGESLRLPQFPQLTSSASQPLSIPGEVSLAWDWRMSASLKAISGVDRERWTSNEDPYRAAFDRDALPQPLTLRVRRRGDRIQPLGMDGTVKLSDLFINAGIPQSARPLWPVIAHGEDVIWVAGLHMADFCRLKESTTEVVVLQLFSPEKNRAEQLDSA